MHYATRRRTSQHPEGVPRSHLPVRHAWHDVRHSEFLASAWSLKPEA